MARKQFALNLFFVIALNLLIKPLWIFGIDRTIQNQLGAEVYGLYYTLFNFSLLSSFILDMGITNFNNRSIAQNPQLLKEYFPGIVTLKFFLSCIYILISLLILAPGNINGEVWNIVLLLLVNQVLSSIILFCRSNISGLQHFKTDSVFSILDRTLAIVFIGSLILFAPEFVTIQKFVLAQTLALALAAAFAVIITFRFFSFSTEYIQWEKLKHLLKLSFPYALLFFLMTMYNRIDTLLLSTLSTEGTIEAGIYAAGYRLFDAGNNFGFLMAGILLPLFAKLLSDKSDVRPIISLAVKIFLSIGFIGLGISIFHHKSIYHLLYNDSIVGHSNQLIWFMVALIASISNYIFGTLLTADGQIKTLIYIALSTIAVNLSINIFFIPSIGSAAAAMACGIAQAFNAVMVLAFCIQNYRLKIQAIELLKALGLVALFVSSLWLFQHFQHWLMQVLMSIVITLSIGVAIRFFPLKSAIQAFKYRK